MKGYQSTGEGLLENRIGVVDLTCPEAGRVSGGYENFGRFEGF